MDIILFLLESFRIISVAVLGAVFAIIVVIVLLYLRKRNRCPKCGGKEFFTVYGLYNNYGFYDKSHTSKECKKCGWMPLPSQTPQKRKKFQKPKE